MDKLRARGCWPPTGAVDLSAGHLKTAGFLAQLPRKAAKGHLLWLTNSSTLVLSVLAVKSSQPPAQAASARALPTLPPSRLYTRRPLLSSEYMYQQMASCLVLFMQ